MKSVGDDMPVQQARVRKLLVIYTGLGQAGMFGAMMIRQALAKADEAVISGDIVEILRAYEVLKGLE